jgi:molecular chaperone HscC
MSKVIGIDLGTTNSAAAYMTDAGPKLIPNALGDNLTPSVIGLDEEGKLLVGQAAREYRVMQPGRCASMFKRLMGSDRSIQLPGRKFSAEELSSLILRSLKDDAEAFFDESIERAVITVPAYFNDQQRRATINAGKIAGFKVERIFNEPTAAALAYGFHEQRDDKILLIVDLGGGTFDVSVVEIFDGAMEVRASSGESFLGGEDFTRTLAARILEQHGFPFERTEMEAPLLVARMIQQCEGAKCRLSRMESTSVRLANRKGVFNDQSPEVPIARSQFETWTRHILGRIELPIRRVLGDAKLRRDEVHDILLVGGATRMSQFVERMTELMGKPPQGRLNPDEVVAMGAAVQAGLIAQDESVEELVVTDVAPFTLGIEITKHFGSEYREGYFLPVIHRNTTIPASRVERVSTLQPHQTSINVRIFQGEGRRVEDNILLGEFDVKGIPHGPAGQEIDVRFTYDLNGVLEVEATIVKTGKRVTHVVAKHAKGLTADQVRKAVIEMEKLKAHPREEQVNRVLLRRAERLFAELPVEGRQILGQLLDAFEGAMGMQDPAAIATCRMSLQEFLDRVEGPDGAAEEGADDEPDS